MPAVAACPDPAKLSQLLVGAATAEEIESFAQHLESCSTCVQWLEQTEVSSQMLNAMRQPAQTAPLAIDGRMQALMDRLGKLAYPASDPQETAATPAPHSQDAQTSVEGMATAGGETERDLLAGLEPAKDSSELGRLGTYRILKVLGVGGMGVVYQAEDTTLKRTVALKAMKPALASSSSARERFLREAQAAAAVRHDHVVTIYQAGECQQVVFLAMELLHGESLEDRLKREGRLPVAETLRIGREIAEGLAAAHASDLIHRDIKPSNLWLEQGRGRVKILDFGLARATAGDVKLTQSGTILGTPAYMAPEQANGDPVDARADLFSLGCVLYRMATGELPFKGDGVMQILRAIELSNPIPPSAKNPEISKELSELIMKLLHKRPGDRVESATEAIQRLRTLEESVRPLASFVPAQRKVEPAIPASASISAIPAKTATRVQGRPSWKILIGILLALVVGVGAYFQGGTILRIATNNGELIVEVDNDDIEVSVKQGGAVIVDRKNKHSFVLTAKGGEVEFFDPATGVRLLTKEFKLERGGVTVVRAREELAKARKVTPPEEKGKAFAIVATGEPLAPVALVTNPAKIKGVRSWTLETRYPRGGINSGNSICSYAFSPNYRWLATFGLDACVRIWDTKDGSLAKVLLGHETGWYYMHSVMGHYRYIQSLSWSPDGNKLASGSGGAEPVQVWDVSSGRRLFSLARGELRAFTVRWSPDGKTIATGHSNGRVLLWNAATGTREFYLGSHGDCARFMAWSGDSKLLASNGNDFFGKGKVILWDASQGRQLDELPTKARYAFPLSLSPKGDMLCNLNEVWSLAEKGRARKLSTLQLFKGDERSPNFAWLDRERKLAYGGGLYDTTTGQPLSLDPDKEPLMLRKWLAKGTLQFLAKGGLGISLYSNYPGEILDGQSGTKVGVIPAHPVDIPSISASPDGKLMAATDGFSKIAIWDLRRLELSMVSAGLGGNPHTPVAAWAWSADSKRVYPFYSWGGLKAFDVQHRRFLGISASIGVPSVSVPYLAAVSDGHVDLYEVETLKKVMQIGEKKDEIQRVSISPKGDYLLTTDKANSRVLLWKADAPTKPVKALDEARFPCFWSPDGKWFISKGGLLWNGKAGTLERDLKIAGSLLTWLADSKHFVGRDADSNVCFWDITTGKQIRKSPAKTQLLKIFPDQAIGAMTIFPDGKMGAVPSGPGCVSVISLDSGKNIATFVLLDKERGLVISAEGHFKGSPNAEREIVYVVETDRGQETLTPAQMEKKYGWKNDPDKVRLSAGQGEKTATSEPTPKAKDEPKKAAASPSLWDIRRLALLKPEDAKDMPYISPPPGAVVLFDGKNLNEWKSEWPLHEGGIMEATGRNLVSKKTFGGKFKLHVEFRVPYMPNAKGQGRGNSGVFLMGRYEVQILDSYGVKSKDSDCGGIWSVAAPLVNACKAPSVWQTFDVQFQAPRCENGKIVEAGVVTVHHNGTLIHNKVRLATNKNGKEEFITNTGMGISGEPCSPGPIFLQYHGNPVQFRNIWLLPLKK